MFMASIALIVISVAVLTIAGLTCGSREDDKVGRP